MEAFPTRIPEVLVLEPKVFSDARGHFFEAWNARTFGKLTGCTKPFVQDNQSHSVRGVLRGLHYQLPPKPQDKLVRVLSGEILDVAVDVRRHSKTFGQWVGVHLSAENKRQLWVPAGFAHGFSVLSEMADVQYKVTEFFAPETERCIVWNDPDLAIAWGVSSPIVAAKDLVGTHLRDAEAFPQ